MPLQHYFLYCTLLQLSYNSLKPSGDGLFTRHHIIIESILDYTGNEVVIVKAAVKYTVDLIHCFSLIPRYKQNLTAKNMNAGFIVKRIYSQTKQKRPHVIAPLAIAPIKIIY